MRIKQAASPREIEAVRNLFRQYEAFLNVDLHFQHFEEELARLPGKYAPPTGALLVAFTGAQPVGCVALRRLDARTCEMKRLFVIPETRRTGLGRRLAREIIARAREIGYTVMRLDTLDRLTEAMHLYEALGFRRTAPYYANPLSGVVYWELDLTKRPATRQQPGPNR